jgi:hypothetical protein
MQHGIRHELAHQQLCYLAKVDRVCVSEQILDETSAGTRSCRTALHLLLNPPTTSH